MCKQSNSHAHYWVLFGSLVENESEKSVLGFNIDSLLMTQIFFFVKYSLQNE